MKFTVLNLVTQVVWTVMACKLFRPGTKIKKCTFPKNQNITEYCNRQPQLVQFINCAADYFSPLVVKVTTNNNKISKEIVYKKMGEEKLSYTHLALFSHGGPIKSLQTCIWDKLTKLLMCVWCVTLTKVSVTQQILYSITVGKRGKPRKK